IMPSSLILEIRAMVSPYSIYTVPGFQGEVLEGRAEILHLGDVRFQLVQKIVIRNHCGHSGSDTDRGCNQCLTDWPGNDIQACRSRCRYILERMHDAPNSSEQSYERCRRTYAG